MSTQSIPSRGAARRSPRDEAGAAVVDFVLVMILLLPLFLGVLQVALVLHVRNTVASAAAEGARYAATWEATERDGLAKARDHYSGVVSSALVGDPRIERVEINGAPAYRVLIEVRVPTLGLGGPAVEFQVSGSAIIEPDPRSFGGGGGDEAAP